MDVRPRMWFTDRAAHFMPRHTETDAGKHIGSDPARRRVMVPLDVHAPRKIRHDVFPILFRDHVGHESPSFKFSLHASLRRWRACSASIVDVQ